MISIVPTAQAAVDAQAFGKVVDPIINNIVNPVVELMFAVALVAFVYGVLQLVWGDEGKRDDAKRAIWMGVIGMFIMVSAWGIIYVIANTVNQIK